MTLDQARQVLGIGRNLAYQASRAGEFPSFRIGKRHLVSKSALKEWLDNGWKGM